MVSSTTVTTFWHLYWAFPHFNGVLSSTEDFVASRFVTCDSCNIYRSQSAMYLFVVYHYSLVIFTYFAVLVDRKDKYTKTECLCGPSLVSERVSDLAFFLYDHDPDPIASPVENSCTIALKCYQGPRLWYQSIHKQRPLLLVPSINLD